MEKIKIVKEFTDRVESLKIFLNRCEEMRQGNSKILVYYGAGGVGKTRLLRKLIDEINRAEQKDLACAKYDFDGGTDMRSILNLLKTQLIAQGLEFKAFETGEYYYLLKSGRGKDSERPTIKAVKEKYALAHAVKDNWGKVATLADVFMPGIYTVATAISFVGEKFFGGKNFDTAYENLIEAWKIENVVEDELHTKLKFRLNEARYSDNPNDLAELLPKLFALDISDSLKSGGNNKNFLAIFLDTYEVLTAQDSWLREIISGAENTFWIIGGRNKIIWNDEISEKLDQHLIAAFSENDADYFLKKAGVQSKNLREKLWQLTQGSPLFLDLCVDVYEKYVNDKGVEPDISKFGNNRENVVSRLIKYMDAGTRDMINFLCILNRWTDEIAREIGGKALPNFSDTIYKQSKNFSFINSEIVTLENFSVTVYSFDRTIQNILFPSGEEYIIKKIRAAIDEYFSAKLNDENSKLDGEFIFNLEYWAKFTVRFAADADELRTQYEKNFEVHVNNLAELAIFDSAENIINLFCNKISNAESVSCAAFELILGDIKSAQGKYLEALNCQESSYEKISALLDEDNPLRITALNNLARTLSELGRHAEALSLMQQVYQLDDTITSMNNLGICFQNVGDCDSAFELLYEVFDIRRQTLGENNPETILAMHNIAGVLKDMESYSEALEYQERALELGKIVFGENHPHTILFMDNLAAIYRELEEYDAALTLHEQAVNLSKKILGEKHPNTIFAMNNKAETLIDADRWEEAAELKGEVRNLFEQVFGTENLYTINFIEGLANFLWAFGRQDEAIKLFERVFNLRQKILDCANNQTVDAATSFAFHLKDMNCVEESLKVLQEFIDLQEKTLTEEKIFARATPLNNLANLFIELGRYEEALPLQEKALKIRREKIGVEENDTVQAMNDLAENLYRLKRFEDALKVQTEAWELAQKIFAKYDIEKIFPMFNLAKIFYKLGRSDKAAEMIERAYELSCEVLDEDEILAVEIAEFRKKISGVAKEIDSSESIILQKGQRVNLPQNISALAVEFCRNDADFEVDASAFLIGKSGKVSADENFIFYGNLKHSSGGVEYLEDRAQIKIELRKIPAGVEKIEFTLTLYDAEKRGQTFRNLSGLFVRVVDTANCKEILRYDLENFSVETAIVVGEIYRYKGAWKFAAIGAGFKGGLESLCKNFGVEVN